ncbi:MAG TPA: DUF1707 domain-containing protein [Longimicrobiales bacterium]|nr:DUF1707 domain-containing protein [Longimicrobiales bacterium]
MNRPLPQLGLEQRRERTVALLCDHFAQDRLELGEFEARLDSAHRATAVAELDQLLQDLPAPPVPAADALARGARALRAHMRDSRTMFAVMGGVERSGAWTPARRTVVITVMGGADLDFREVTLAPGITEVHLFCFMGGARIIVPPGLAVDASGIAIMGGFGHSAPPAAVPPDAPVLRVSGFCLMGGADIEVRLPGESRRDARQRRRSERRRRRPPDGR